MLDVLFEQDKIKAEHAELMKLIAHLEDILSNEPLRMKIIKDELIEIREKYGDERRTRPESSVAHFGAGLYLKSTCTGNQGMRTVDNHRAAPSC